MALDLTEALSSPLRDLHDGIVSQLVDVFGDDAVRAHSTAVTADTVARYSQGKLATWAVIGGAEGLEESTDTVIRARVRWGIFVIAQPHHETPDAGQPDHKRQVAAVAVAETVANYVARLAVYNRWGLEIENCDGVPPHSISIRNLGVGIKTAGDLAETEDLGLFVVWGSNDLDLGEQLFPGDEPLPIWDLISGTIRDHAKPDARPEIKFRLERIIEWLADRFRPAWQHRAAAAINAAMREGLGHA